MASSFELVRMCEAAHGRAVAGARKKYVTEDQTRFRVRVSSDKAQ